MKTVMMCSWHCCLIPRIDTFYCKVHAALSARERAELDAMQAKIKRKHPTVYEQSSDGSHVMKATGNPKAGGAPDCNWPKCDCITPCSWFHKLG